MESFKRSFNKEFLERERRVLSLIKEKNVFPIGCNNDEIMDYLLDCMYISMIDGTCLDQRLSVKDLYERKYKNYH